MTHLHNVLRHNVPRYSDIRVTQICFFPLSLDFLQSFSVPEFAKMHPLRANIIIKAERASRIATSRRAALPLHCRKIT